MYINYIYWLSIIILEYFSTLIIENKKYTIFFMIWGMITSDNFFFLITVSSDLWKNWYKFITIKLFLSLFQLLNFKIRSPYTRGLSMSFIYKENIFIWTDSIYESIQLEINLINILRLNCFEHTKLFMNTWLPTTLI